jgi:hypothetical protein
VPGGAPFMPPHFNMMRLHWQTLRAHCEDIHLWSVDDVMETLAIDKDSLLTATAEDRPGADLLRKRGDLDDDASSAKTTARSVL